MGHVSKDPVIETERLVMRAVELADASRIVSIINDPGVARMTTAIPHPYTLADAEAFLRAQAVGGLGHQANLKIETRGGILLGGVGVRRTDGPFREIGFWLGRSFWGEGVATEATGAMIDWARRVYGSRAFTAGHFADNQASGRVLIKCGFLYTGAVEPRFSVSRGETAATRLMIWLA